MPTGRAVRKLPEITRTVAPAIGVLWPQGGGAPVLVTCYLTRSMASGEQRDAAIAQVARTVAAARETFTRS